MPWSFICKISKIHLKVCQRTWRKCNSDWSPLRSEASKFCPFMQGKTVQYFPTEVEKNRRDMLVFFYCSSNKGRTLLTSAFNILLQSSHFAWFFVSLFSPTRHYIFARNLTLHYFEESHTTARSSLFLQIDFGSLRKVTRIATMGGSYPTFFYTTFKLEYGRNGLTWEKYREYGQVKVSAVSQADAFSGLVGRWWNTNPLKTSLWETKPVCVYAVSIDLYSNAAISIFRTTTAWAKCKF